MIPGLITKDAVLHLDRELESGDEEQLRLVFSKTEGVESITSDHGTVFVAFYPEIVGLSAIIENFTRLGYRIVQDRKQRNPFKKFLGNLSESNQKTFGSERLDCCTLKDKFKKH